MNFLAMIVSLLDVLLRNWSAVESQARTFGDSRSFGGANSFQKAFHLFHLVGSDRACARITKRFERVGKICAFVGSVWFVAAGRLRLQVIALGDHLCEPHV